MKKISVLLAVIGVGATLTGCCMSHEWQEANYQQPKTCMKCGETEGERLIPAFEELGVQGKFMELGKEYDYETMCALEPKAKSVGKVTVTEYQTVASDDTHEAKEGYEWRTVDMTSIFSDSNAKKFAPITWRFWCDYYDMKSQKDSVVEQEDGSMTFTLNWKGQEYTECQQRITAELGKWEEDKAVNYYHYELLLPAEYDGYILGFSDYTDVYAEAYVSDYANENTLFFRLQ